jgi:asparagine synthase (glutamine-hydrolysing)
MCGIFGQFSNGVLPNSIEDLCSATNYLRHRGPDDGSFWAENGIFFGHRRLSIIDSKLGAQPLASSDGRYVIIFNGEIYNYHALKLELESLGYKFSTNSDTEVIVAGYSLWSENICNKLIGMFAFAIFDRHKNSLFLSRDRFGEKPLYIQKLNTSITFSSEIGAFCQLASYSPTLNYSALKHYLCLNYVPGNQTLIESIERFPAATWRRYSKTKIEEGSYWSPTFNESQINLSYADAQIELRKLIDKSIRESLTSDVPVTLMLSGGIDSSILAESAARQKGVTQAYCLDVEGETYGEYPAASYVAKKLGLELIRIPFNEMAMSDFFSIANQLDDPLADSSAIAVWQVAKAVSKDYKVIIGGDGADELFGGYLTYPATLLHQKITRFFPAAILRSIAKISQYIPVSDKKVSASYKLKRFLRASAFSSNEAHFTWNGSWLPEDASRLLTHCVAQANQVKAFSSFAGKIGILNNLSLLDLQMADLKNYLPNDILTKVDRTTMAFGLEARSPFLAPEIANFALSLPSQFRLGRGGQTKPLLRSLATNLFGENIGHAKKQGFSIPIHSWLRGIGLPIMNELLSEKALLDLPFLDYAVIREAKSAHLDHKEQIGFELWGLMVLVTWYRSRILLQGFKKENSYLKRIVV